MDTSRDQTQDLTEHLQPLRRDETVVMSAPFQPEPIDETLIGGVEKPPVLALALAGPAGRGADDGHNADGATQFIGSPFAATEAATVTPPPSRRPRKLYLLAGALVAVGLGLLAARGFAPSQAELAETPAPIEEQAEQPALAGVPLEPGIPTVASFDLDQAQLDSSALDGQLLQLEPTLAERFDRPADLSALDARGEAGLLEQALPQQEAELLGQALPTEPTETAPAEAAASEPTEASETVAEESAPADEPAGESSLELADQGAALEAASEAEPAVEQAVASQSDDDEDDDRERDGRPALSQLGPAAEQAASRLGFGR